MASTALHSPVPHRIRYGEKRKRRSITLGLLLIALVAAGVLLVLPRHVFTASAENSEPVITHTVVRGDTLWDLAVRYSGEGDIRDAVKAIRETNHLKTAELRPGQVVLIPIARR